VAKILDPLTSLAIDNPNEEKHINHKVFLGQVVSISQGQSSGESLRYEPLKAQTHSSWEMVTLVE
jgi:hypothetical protein